MFDAISLGSLTLDLFFQDDSLTIRNGRFFLALGGKYVVEHFGESMGGGGANVAIGLSRAGIQTALWSQIGTEGLSLYMRTQLEAEGIHLTLMQEKPDFANLSAIVLSPKGERAILTHRSSHIVLDLSQSRMDALKHSRVVFIGNLPESSLLEREKIAKIARSAGAMVAVNLGVKDCRRGAEIRSLLKQATIIILNRYELADALGIPANELALGTVNYHNRLQLEEGCILAITDGEFGAYAQTKMEIFFQPAHKLSRARDTTGAGDAFTSGFLSALFYGKNEKEALVWGSKNAASVIAKLTAQSGLLRKEELMG